jgi:hypothetical protein
VNFCLTILSLCLFGSSLETEEIVERIPMQEFLQQKGHTAHFTSPVYLVTLESGLKAVLKEVDPAWPQDAVSEVAAYRASQLLDLDLVPPTVLYVKKGVVGSLQQYIEPSVDLMVGDNYEKALENVPAEELAHIALFDFVFGQWDRDASNIIASDNHFVLIDNAAIGYTQKVRYGEYPFVLCFPETQFREETDPQSFPFDAVRTLPPVPDRWREAFGGMLREGQIRRLCRSWKDITFVVWKGHFWRQYGYGKPAYTDFYPPNTMRRLQELTLEQLQALFQNDLGFTFSDQYFQDILDRRNQVLTYFLRSL